MSESPVPREAVVTWDIEPNGVDGTMDFVFEVSPQGDALIDVQRFIPLSHHDAARRLGVSERELEGPMTVAENIPIRRGRGSWRDFFCEVGLTYQYRVRAHHVVAPSETEGRVASAA